jgi:uracil-DNA glycosylase
VVEAGTVTSSVLDGIDPDWAEALAPVEAGLAAMADFLREETAAGRSYLPADEHILRAFAQPLDNVRVVIVGKDPYPTRGHATGVAFSVERNVRPLPHSVANIHAELRDDLGIGTPEHGDLTAWTQRGVLLLNRCLTVAPVRALAARGGPLVAVLLGSDARRLAPLLASVPWVACGHPSVRSAERGFFGSRPFTRANALLVEQRAAAIDWSLD